MSEKIIMLDFDGVLLPQKSYLTNHNRDLTKELNDRLADFDGDRYDRYKIENDYIIQFQFDETAVKLVNRACEITGAKVVILSNWRRRFKPESLKQKLVLSGLDEKHFHENFFCHHKMNSGKAEEIYMWVYQNDPDEKNRYVIIDDVYLSSDYRKNAMQVCTTFADGFTVNEYRVVIGFFGDEDREYDVYKLSPDLMERVKKYFYSESKMYEELYLLSRNNGYTVPRATLLSYDSAVEANKDKSGALFLGLPTYSDDELYELRSKDVLRDLELTYGKREFNPRVLMNSGDLGRFNIDMGDFDKHPIKYPCLIKDVEKAEYIYAPESCRDEFDYLNGFSAALF